MGKNTPYHLQDFYGNFPIHTAAIGGEVEIVKYFISIGKYFTYDEDIVDILFIPFLIQKKHK